MSQVNINLLQAIQKDDLVNFSILIKNNESLSFGRFPVLSVCYLYNSRKIIKNYKDKLIKIKNFKVSDEPYEIYKAFKLVAGRTLRFYIGENNIVSPLEMLAILNKDGELKSQFKRLKPSEEIAENLVKIYKIYGREVLIQNNEIKLSRKILSNYQKKPYKFALSFSICFVFLVSLSFILTNFITGIGTSWSPFIVYNQNQLYLALKSNSNFILGSDISISDDILPVNFFGNFDGNNYKILVNTTNQNYLINNNYGEIKNLNIVYNDFEKELSSNFSFLVNSNLGNLQNINITCNELKLNCNKLQNSIIYVSGLSNINKGEILGCKLNLKANITASGNGECFFSGFSGQNFGKIENCIFNENSSVMTSEIDIAGICVYNELNANILNCKNYASLSQTSSLLGWSPNVAGVVLTNYGNVQNSYNFANLNCSSIYSDQEKRGSVFLGGICSMNYGNITKCLNKGNLTANSNNLIVYCGGITAYSSYYLKDLVYYVPNISGCGVDCSISANTQDSSTFVFAGGISGYFESLIYNYRIYGAFYNCYSIVNFEQSNNDTNLFIGSCIGSCYFYSDIYGNFILNAQNNHVLKQSNINYQIGCLINRTQDIFTGEIKTNIINKGIDSPNEEIKNSLTIDEIKQKEIYWND